MASEIAPNTTHQAGRSCGGGRLLFRVPSVTAEALEHPSSGLEAPQYASFVALFWRGSASRAQVGPSRDTSVSSSRVVSKRRVD